MVQRLPVRRDGKIIYDIVLTQDFQDLAPEIAPFHLENRRICIVSDSTVSELYLEQIRLILNRCCRTVTDFVFPAGEKQKNLDTVRDLYRHLIENQFDRNDLLVALGGGVTGDLCGYAAATYLRGISFIQIPTTLLAQVDSSIGGKTGVDFDAYKNMVGAFHMPRLVYTNVSTLKTLPEEQYSSGMGEIIKHGLIRDYGYFCWLMDNRDAIVRRDPEICLSMIRRSSEIKRQVVEKDPTEQGERALLNFGHTLGHAIEKHMNFQMLHGHCVGLGMLAAGRISLERGFISREDLNRIREAVAAFGMPVTIGTADADAIIQSSRNDKKMDGGKIRFVLLQTPGNAVIDRTVTEDEMREGLSEILE